MGRVVSGASAHHGERAGHHVGATVLGEWLPLIDRRHYHRNLFDGLDVAPDVEADAVLIVADRERPDDLPGFCWLRSVALDRSTPFRGLAVVAQARAGEFPGSDLAVYRPVSSRVGARSS